MKDHKFRDFIYWGVTAVLVIVSCIVVALIFLKWGTVKQTLKALNKILAPIIYGAILAYLLSPVYNKINRWIQKRTKSLIKDGKSRRSFGKTVATLSSLVLLIAVIVGFFWMMIPQLWESITGIVNSVPTYIQVVSHWIQEAFANYPELETTIMTYFNQETTKLVSWLQSAGDLIPNLEKVVTSVYTGVMSIINALKNILIGVIVMVYLLNVKDRLCAQAKKCVYGVCSIRMANEIVDKVRFVHKVFGGFIIGKLVDSLIIGIITFVLLSIVNMPYTLLISVIVGVTNVIPFFGPFIGAIPSAVLLLLVSPKKCLIFLVLILIIQQFDGNILGPKILGESTGVSSFWVLFSILFFGGVLGPLGMIIGVPTFAVIYRLVAEFVEKRLMWKHLSTSTSDYGALDHIDENQKTFINRDLEE